MAVHSACENQVGSISTETCLVSTLKMHCAVFPDMNLARILNFIAQLVLFVEAW